MRGRSFDVLALLVILSLAVLPVTAQDPESEQEPEQNQEAEPDAEPDQEGIRPYEEVITDAAVSDEGIFTVHKVDDKFYYEIPASELGSEFLWVGRISRNSLGQGYGGMKLDTRVVKWERHDDSVLLRNVAYDVVADQSLPIAQAVADSNTDTILRAFDIAAEGEDDSVVIDVTSLFATEGTGIERPVAAPG